MSWKFWKKKDNSEEVSVVEIQARIRGFVLDSQINNAHEIALILGASMMSPEVMEKEEEESEKRVQKISYLIPMIYAHSHALAEGATEIQRTLANQIELESGISLPDEVWHESQKLMEQVSMSALIGSISQMIDMGLLEIPKQRRKK